MENLDPRGGERRTNHEFEYVLWVALRLVIHFVMSGDVGTGVPRASYLGASNCGGSAWRRDGRGGTDDNLILQS